MLQGPEMINSVACWMASIPAQTLKTTPDLTPDDATKILRGRLVDSESHDELLQALGLRRTDEPDGRVVYTVDPDSAFEPVTVLDALADILYVTYGTAVAFGYPMTAAFELVHANNMLKLKTGTIDAGGKLVKAPDHPDVGPDLAGLLEATAEVADLFEQSREQLAKHDYKVQTVFSATAQHIFGSATARRIYKELHPAGLPAMFLNLAYQGQLPPNLVLPDSKTRGNDFRKQLTELFDQLPIAVKGPLLTKFLDGVYTKGQFLLVGLLQDALLKKLPINPDILSITRQKLVGYSEPQEGWTLEYAGQRAVTIQLQFPVEGQTATLEDIEEKESKRVLGESAGTSGMPSKEA